MIAVAVGIIAAGWLPQLPSNLLAGAVLLGVTACVSLPAVYRGRVRATGPAGHWLVIWMLQACLCVAVGMSWGIVAGNRSMQAWLPPQLEGVDFWLYGVVDSLPELNGRAWQFEYKVTGQCFVLHPDGCHDGERPLQLRRVLLNHYGEQRLEPGQHWRLRVRLNRPHGLANPGGFDYELMLLQRGIDAKGYVRETSFNQLLSQRFSYQRVRYQLLQRLQAATAHMPQRGIIAALALGERSGISDAQWDLFTQTGTNHLVVISGLHIGFVAGVCYWLVNLLARLLPGLLLLVPAQKLGAIGAIAGAAVYSLLAGFSLPTQRSLIMVCVFMAGRLVAREFPVSFGYTAALLLVLLVEPLGAMSAGFWLSFVAVASLLLAFTCRIEHREFLEPEPEGFTQHAWQFLRSRARWSIWGRPQWVVFVGMTVPLILWLQQLSLSSPVANIIAIPLVSLLVVPLCLSGLLLLYLFEPAGLLLLMLADQLLGLLLWLLAAIVALLPALEVLQFAGLRQAVYPFAALGCLLLLLPRGWPGRYLAPIMLLPLLVPAKLPAPVAGEAWVTVLDVGQGLSVLVQTSRHALLYDAGPGFVDGFSAGRSIIVPVLRRFGIRQLDAVMISHGDNDHAGGLPGLLETIPAQKLFTGTPLSNPPQMEPLPCRSGQAWRWDGVDFEVLHPAAATYRQRNDNSCVLRVSTGSQSLLLPGDIEAAEADLLQAHGNSLQSDYLVAPHHGSDSSSSLAFIDAVRPRHVIFAAGYRNQFAHPDSAIQQRYRDAGALLYNTASSGALMLRLGPESGSVPVAWRDERKRYWYIDGDLVIK